MDNEDFETITKIVESGIAPLNANIQDIRSLIEKRENQIICIKDDCAELDKRVALIEKELEHNNGRIGKLEEFFNGIKKDIIDLKNNIQKELESLKESVKAITKNRLTPKFMITILLTSPPLTIFITWLFNAIKQGNP